MFDDDSVFFFRACEAKCWALKNVLSLYEKAPSHAMNFNKSGVFYNSNVHEGKIFDLANCLCVLQALDTSRYLRLPTLIRRNKKSVFSYV